MAFFIQASAIGAQAFLIREYKGVGTALLGNLSLAAGFLLTIFRDILPDFLTIIIANILILQGANLFYIAVSRFTGQSHNKAFVLALTGAVLLLLIYYRYVMDNLGMRIIAFSLCAAISATAASYKLWQARKASYRFSVALTFIPFVVYTAFLLFRVIATTIAPPKEAFANTPIQIATFLLLFLLSFLWTIGFILMVSQRLQIDLHELATIDSLTRIPNRLAAQIFLERNMRAQ